MYIMKCAHGGDFARGELRRFANIEISPSAGVLNYGQGLFEGLKAYRMEDGKILLLYPSENALKLQMGAERMCMPAPTVELYIEAVKDTVLANKRWIPPLGKGFQYIRPLLMGSGSVLGIAHAPEYTFLIYLSPVGNYFKEGMAPINLVIETDGHRYQGPRGATDEAELVPLHAHLTNGYARSSRGRSRGKTSLSTSLSLTASPILAGSDARHVLAPTAHQISEISGPRFCPRSTPTCAMNLGHVRPLPNGYSETLPL